MSKLHFLSRYWLIISILILAFVLRLYKLSNSPLDWHAWRQADTASVTREYVKDKADLLHPQFQDVSNIPSGQDNLKGYRMVEFPLVNIFAAWLIKDFHFPFTETSRMISVIFSLGTCAALFFLVQSLSGKKTAYLTALLFGIIP
jgi:hypothetical protein